MQYVDANVLLLRQFYGNFAGILLVPLQWQVHVYGRRKPP